MIIEEKDFRLTPVKESADAFDLELLTTVNKGKENERQEFKIAAYGVNLFYALKYVANFRIQEKYSGVIDLKTYLEEYKKILTDLKSLVV